jgi:hypothetical protein
MMLICATDDPKITGIMSLRIRLTPSCAAPHFGRGNKRARIKKGI